MNSKSQKTREDLAAAYAEEVCPRGYFVSTAFLRHNDPGSRYCLNPPLGQQQAMEKPEYLEAVKNKGALLLREYPASEIFVRLPGGNTFLMGLRWMFFEGGPQSSKETICYKGVVDQKILCEKKYVDEVIKKSLPENVSVFFK